MNDYQTLSADGQAAIRSLIGNVCRPDVNADAFFEDVEQARNDGRDDFEIRSQYTRDGRPLIVGLLDEWFA